MIAATRPITPCLMCGSPVEVGRNAHGKLPMCSTVCFSRYKTAKAHACQLETGRVAKLKRVRCHACGELFERRRVSDWGCQECLKEDFTYQGTIPDPNEVKARAEAVRAASFQGVGLLTEDEAEDKARASDDMPDDGSDWGGV